MRETADLDIGVVVLDDHRMFAEGRARLPADESGIGLHWADEIVA